MYCPRCRAKMKEERRSFHKRRKWVCKRCGMVKFQNPRRPETGNRKQGIGDSR